MKTYKEAEAMWENSRKRKLQNNTYLVKTDNGFGIRLHGTIVVEYLPDRTILNSGGWKTSTTKQRINEYMPAGWQIYQKAGVWYISNYQYYNNEEDNVDFVFVDNCYYMNDGWYGIAANSKTFEKTRKACRKYAKDFTKAMFAGNVPKPSAGDCFYCGMVTVDDNTPLGEKVKDKDHILHHIEENYFVPSLLVNACKMFGVSNAAWWSIDESWQDGKDAKDFKSITGNSWMDIGKIQIESAIRRYCYRQLGLAS